MSDNRLTRTLEAILLAAGRPVSVDQIAELFEEGSRPTVPEIKAALAELAAECNGRAVELREVASGWRIQVRPEHAEIVSRLWQERPTRYSRALLETLALIAYRQPITRAEIEQVRGVSISQTIMRTLQERNWIRVVGHREVPGRPELLGTTREFLDYFGLRSLDDLPTLAELRDIESINVQLEIPGAERAVAATQLTDASGETEETAEEEAIVDDDDFEEPPSSPTMVAAPPGGSEQ
jgi:segregation and condensation protein B